MRVVHAVVTDAFAGTERYVVEVAGLQAALGWDVSVIGGAAVRERLGPGVTWLPGNTVTRALGSAASLRHVDVAHGHLTFGEFALCAASRLHGGRCVATRHLATPRGQSRKGRVLRPFIERRLAKEIAISTYVSEEVSGGSLPVLHNGVAPRDRGTPESSTTIVMAQRLEPEKATMTGLDAWFASALPARGWSLVVAGHGSRRQELEQRCQRDSLGATVTFRGHVEDMDSLYAQAAALLAPAPAEPLGLSVLEAMARGLPVIAAAGGGHLETLRMHPELLFPTGDVVAGARALEGLSDALVRERTGRSLQTIQRADFDLTAHVRTLAGFYRT